jgi:hypothetical protein
MGSYYGSHQTPAGTILSIIVLASPAATRGRIHQVIVGSDATPADVATEYALLRHTTAGITPATTPVAKASDPLMNPAACTLAGGTFATEPVYEAVATNGLLQIPLNQRATYTWIANPGREFATVIGTANGIGLRSVASGGTPNTNATLAWDE